MGTNTPRAKGTQQLDLPFGVLIRSGSSHWGAPDAGRDLNFNCPRFSKFEYPNRRDGR